jgi:hypothetical protein
MLDFTLDHVVIRTPDREALVAGIAEATGLSALQGYATGPEIHSGGVRFANGPFLDIFSSQTLGTALILAGSVDNAERLAASNGWAARMGRREATPPGQPLYPWSMAHFRRGQGLLTQVGVIQYAADPEAWTDPDYTGDLYNPGMELDACASLSRVWMSAQDVARAERDLAVLGYLFSDEMTSAYWPHAGRRLSGLGADLVLFEGPDGVARLDIATGTGSPREIAPHAAPRLVLDEDL